MVDEMSMVDTLLFKTLVAAIPQTMHVVLVGDQDQLPSVGPGQVFRDLLSFAQLPQVRLTQIHRQSAKSTI
ncbi:AAA family ATPase, partial [Anaerostipes hadrus]|nr:AAA family ATPase [Anaerostipes hadrus]